MGEVRWTKEQQAAIDTHGCNLLVAAAAGSGKTAVLVERIIKMITDLKNPVDIDRLLVVTFTNAAASEMRERIAKALGDRLLRYPKSKQLQRQLTLINRANITTMHSFCLDVIKNNFHYIDLDPNFRVADSTEAVLLKGEIIEQMFEDLYQEDMCRVEFLKLVEFYSNNKDDSGLKNIVLDLYNFAMSSPKPRETLLSMAEDFNVDKGFDFEKSKWAKVLMEDIKIELIGIKIDMEKAINLIDNTEGLEVYLENFSNELEMICKLISCCDTSWEDLYNEFENVEFKKLKTCRNCRDKSIQKTVKDIRDKVKKYINNDLKSKISLYESKNIKEDCKNLYPLMKELSDLVIKFMDRYAKSKKERGIIDFNDFEHFCLKILENQEVAEKLKEKYVEILIDEYQDSNDVQETIINAISKKDEITGRSNNVFMVGDVKQSIYRFRQAKPELFLKKYNFYSLDEEAKERKVTLFKNFRSRKEILDAVNFIFKHIMCKNIGEIDYSEKEYLNLGASYKECEDKNSFKGSAVELNIIEKNSKNTEISTIKDEEEEIATNIQLEARLVAEKIKQLINPCNGESFKVYDNSIEGYRNIEYRDIVVLLRSTLNWAPVFMEELRENSIPVYADTGTGYFDTLEIKTMLSLLQIIDNPRQDIPLIAVLRSPVASFSTEELIDIRLKDEKGDFYDALVKMADEECYDEKKSNLKDKCINFLQRFNIWKDKVIHMPIDEFIWYLYTDTGYYGYIGALMGGEQRQANLRILFERARQYEKTSYKGLFNFINFINKLKVSSGDMGSAKILGENENVVRIMSIHKSKGLEFPVVILSGLGKNFNMQDLNKRILFHLDLGFGPDYIDLEKRIIYPTILKQALRKKIKVESLSEEMRILYVALTRAKEKLIMTGQVNDIKKCADKWSYGLYDKGEKLPEHEITKARNYLDWICPVVIRHKSQESLRQMAEVINAQKLNLVDDDSKWYINFYNLDDIYHIEKDSCENKNKDEDKDEDKIFEVCDKGEYYNEINRRLQWKYPYLESSRLPNLLTVTEIKRMQNEDIYDDYSHNIYTPSIVKKPKFLEKNKQLVGAEKGIAMHSIMQKIDYKKDLTKKELERQINDLIKRELITEEQADSIDISKILKFFKSSIGNRILKSDKVFREVPFHIKVKSTEIYKDLPEDKYDDEYIIIQGIIDCYFEEKDYIVLLDYKTDYIKNNDVEAIKEKYKVQLSYYARAIEEITNKEVKEKYLYLFYNDELVRV